MTQETSKTKDPKWDELMAVAKQAIAGQCDITPDEVRVDEDGDIAYDQLESAVVFLGAETEPPAFIFKSLVLSEVEEKPLVYEVLNELNKNIKLGSFFLMDGDVYFSYTLLVDSPTPELVTSALQIALGIADHYDDGLKSRLGGERFIEEAEDEIEV
ncbi:MAG: YbjN domain-containing protein [Cyanobacteria bacterium]|nr:YbjN domain-containing protein [Cyanobacteriota bacterium]